MGSLPISQCPCHPEEEGRKQHGDPWSPVRGSEALRRPCCGRDAERPGQGSPARPPRRQLPQPGLEGPRQPEAVRTRPGRPGRLYLSPVPQSTSCPETDWTCLHMAWSPPMPVLPGNSALPGVCVCVMKGHSQTLWASDSPHSLETVPFLVCVCVCVCNKEDPHVSVCVCVCNEGPQPDTLGL